MRKIFIDNISDTGTCSILIREIDPETFEAQNHREALVPGQFERAMEMLPDNLYAVMEALWTPEVIAAWQQKQTEMKEQASTF
ncbi:hypothetical protein U6B65_13325 [Oscillospiraceae bacterium MB08-C2-2]|nr:hypothetical protein U6B65_13325 [Oscillospiraceae bacterium MB08-C2-2]